MAVCPEESVRFAQPLTGITVTVAVVSGRANALAAHEIYRCLQCMNEIWQWRTRRGRIAILVQPAACRSEIAAAAMTILGAKIAVQMTIREVNFTIDQPAWIFE
jgi:hypothetical protein